MKMNVMPWLWWWWWYLTGNDVFAETREQRRQRFIAETNRDLNRRRK